MKTHNELELEAYIRGDTLITDLYSRLIQNEQIYNELEGDVEHWRKRAIKAEGELEEAKYILESLSK